MRIESFGHDGEGLSRVYENDRWMVAVKNWKPANDIEGIDCLERHNETDELFILLAGRCVLLSGVRNPGGGTEIEAVSMEPGRLYKIPRGLWHNTVTRKDTKLLLVEAPETSMANSEVLPLDEAEKAAARELARKSL
ncbi:MAG: cupin [Treponema sp.]|nr:cupin [Treponema sp.]